MICCIVKQQLLCNLFLCKIILVLCMTIIVVKVTARSVSLITTGIDSYHRSYTSCFLCGKKQ